MLSSICIVRVAQPTFELVAIVLIFRFGEERRLRGAVVALSHNSVIMVQIGLLHRRFERERTHIHTSVYRYTSPTREQLAANSLLVLLRA